ncbi:IclR family transcriptional regulator [Comamonadaceae bacterium G21597-S1]|nr:IclR family transcriptional regulator [Comamonadaceae bacterium G21597-S1]
MPRAASRSIQTVAEGRKPKARKTIASDVAPERHRAGGVDQHFGAANSTAERAIDILLLFTDDKPFWTANDIATHFGMPKSTVYRYVNSLRSYALIDEDGQGGFRLGPRIFPLARTAKAGMSVIKLAYPHIKQLADRFGEMVVLQQRVGYDILPLERIQPPQRVSLQSTRSHLLPWPATSSAKLLLAFAPQGEQDEILRMLHPTSYTGKTLQSKASLRVALDQVRKVGYAITDEERDEGVWGAAAPVFENGSASYALAIAAPKFRMTAQTTTAIVAAVMAAAEALSKDIAAVDF